MMGAIWIYNVAHENQVQFLCISDWEKPWISQKKILKNAKTASGWYRIKPWK